MTDQHKQSSERLIIMGRLGMAHGVKGWHKVTSFTDPDTNLLNYKTWHLNTRDGFTPVTVEETRIQGPYLIAKLAGCNDRETAKTWTNQDIAVPRNDLPDCEDDEFYWSDLEGLRVQTESGQLLGTIDHFLETGSKDVMIIKGDKSHQIPFIMHETVKNVNLEAGIITVDWTNED